MSAAERLAGWGPERFLDRLAADAEGFAWSAGVGGRETAGALVSYLVNHPEHIEAYLNGGIFELPPEWITGGRLTWHGKDGKVYSPEDRLRSTTKTQEGLRVFDPTCTVLIRYSDADGAWLARCPELKPCTAHGATPAEAFQALEPMLTGSRIGG